MLLGLGAGDDGAMGAFVVVLLAVIIVLTTVGARRRRARRADPPPTDLRRVGDGEELSPNDAALRAGGKTAWMRPGGF